MSNARTMSCTGQLPQVIQEDGDGGKVVFCRKKEDEADSCMMRNLSRMSVVSPREAASACGTNHVSALQTHMHKAATPGQYLLCN